MRTLRRCLTTVLPALLVATLITVVAPSAAVAANGPSVPLPGTPSTPVDKETMKDREPDQATRSALKGNQPVSTGSKEGGGTNKATPLSPSASWQVSAQTGDFSWSYPLRVPPAPGGLAPELALSYASSGADGRTSATNNQSSWIGDGWELSPGFVERAYLPCADDDQDGTTPPKVGDLCWRSDNANASYNGGAGMLIRDAATGTWRNKNDDGSRIERLTGAGNGDNDGEYWKITTTDGTQYFFGSSAAAQSTWTVPVFGDDDKEPCHSTSGFDASHCVQAWRWNLDKVVDRNGNALVYTYVAEKNSYGMNKKDAAVSYERAGTLKRVEYGLRADDAAVKATGRVEFSIADRCVPGSDCTPDKKDNWPDVTWDDKCDTATCKDKHAPSFWSTKRLAKITTQVRRGDDFTDVDSWTLDQQFPDPGDGEKASLWLKGITHTGHVGGSLTLPPVTFEGTKLANRVYKIDGYAPLVRYRVTGVVSEAGGVLSVKYAEPNCVADSSMPANPESNTLRCFPQRWTKKDETERTDYFHKYVVAQVTESDRISSSTEQVTAYSYDGAAWHYDTSEFTKDDKRTWNEFRGFGKVQIRTGKPGDPGGPIGKTEQRFYRGMHGDKQPSGTRTASVEPSEGAPRADEDWLQGLQLETITYLGDTNTVVGKTINDPLWRGPTATRGAFKAYLVRPAATQSYTALAAGGWRSTRTEYDYDDRGLRTETDDLGDTATAADDRCTTTSYARNTGRWLLDRPAREETVAVRCDATPVFPRDAISDTRTDYDKQGFGEPPTNGNATRTEELAERPAAGPVYVLTSTAEYDKHGRSTQSGDPLGRLTKTSYAPEVGGPTTQVVVTNQLGHTAKTTYESAWGEATAVVDANGRKTETAFDALGRAVEVWLPNRPRGSNDGSSKFSYRIRNDAPTVVATSKVGPNGRYLTVNSLYDGLLRPRQVQSPATGGGRLLTDTRYDSQGRAFKTTQPYVNDAPVDDELWVASDTEVASVGVTEFDGAGRKVAEVVKGGTTELWRTTTAYGGDRVHVTPPKGGVATTAISDARGQTTELWQHKGGTTAGDFDTTTYTYTKAGQLASTTDPAGNTWRNTYDLRGNTVKVEDADKGTSLISYDAAKQATTATDARGGTLAYEYDPLGRKTAVKSGPTTLAAWTYDTATKGKGLPASSTRYVGGAEYTRTVGSYSNLNLPVSTTVTIPETEETLAGSYTTYANVNVDGSAASKAFPAIGDLPTETVATEYDDIGNPTKLAGGPEGSATAEYVTDTQYTRYGELARVQLGEAGKQVWQSYYYDTHTRQLERTIVDAEVSRPMQSDVNYTYDPFGNVTSVANTPQEKPADVQCFRYDHLRRLTEAWTPGNGCAADPSTNALAGPAPYWQSFSYDAVGNRLTEKQHAAAGDTVRAYAYPQAGAHAVESVTTTTPAGTKKDEFSYDAAGNTTARALASGAQQLVWDPEGKLAKVTEAGKETSFIYDADGNRLIRRDPTGRTLYVDGQELRLDKASGKTTGTRYYEHAGQPVAMRTGAGLTWLASDHQDTAQIAVDSANQQVTLRRQAPFGAPRGAKVDFPGEKGFVGGTADGSTGLTHLGAREYDPLLGRFISVDPAMDLTDAQQMHGYTYANNNPITLSDATGLWPSWGKIWNAVKTVGNGIAEGAKWAAPALGIAALAIGTVATGGTLLAVAAGFTAASMIAGGINAVHACTGGGSGVDCAMEVVGLIPGVGKLAVGAGRFLGRSAVEAGYKAIDKGVNAAGNLADKAGVLNGGAARAWSAESYLGAAQNTDAMRGSLNMLKQNLGRTYGRVDVAVSSSGIGWSACGIQAALNTKGANCMGLPSMSLTGGPDSQLPLPDVPVVRVPIVYPPNFIGPRVRGSVVAPKVGETGGGRPSLPSPRVLPKPRDTSAPAGYRNTGGGVYCPNGGGRCMS